MKTTKTFEAVVHRIEYPAVVVDPENALLHWNDAAAELLGLRQRSDDARPLHQILAARDALGARLGPHLEGLLAMAQRGEAIKPFPITLRLAEGRNVRLVGRPELLSEAKASALLIAFTPERRRQASSLQLDLLLRQARHLPPGEARQNDPPAPPKELPLTPRQLEVLRCLSEGHEMPQIADALGVSVNTVRNHASDILRRLRTHSRTHAVAIAIRRGWI